MADRITPSQQRDLCAERPCPICGGPMVVQETWKGDWRWFNRFLVCDKPECGHKEPVR